MIRKALKLICLELNTFLGGAAPDDAAVVKNISQLDAGNNPNASLAMANRVVMTMVNMSEETSLKNQSPYRTAGSGTTLQNPAIHLNLMVLFVANHSDYEDALMSLSKVVKFFQGKNRFDPDNTADPDHLMDGINYRLVVELHSPTIEELNNLWGMLGGKQLPAALYRIRLVELDRDVVIQSVPLVQTVHLNTVPPV